MSGPQRHVMIDLETMGNVPGSVIVAIGAVAFDVETGGSEAPSHFYRTISLQSCLDVGLTVQGSTVEWWLRQGDAARGALLLDQKTIFEALEDFSKWFPAGAPVWGHGAIFDVSIIEAAFRAAMFEIPWGYRDSRDTRTLFSLVGQKVGKGGVAHNALDDAIVQAQAVIEAYAKLRASGVK